MKYIYGFSSSPGECKRDDFVCSNGQCLEGFRRCNKVMDCVGGEDEKNCRK